MSTDRIEKHVFLRAPRERVWKALTRAEEFGAWFGLEAEGEFAPNTTVGARVVPTKVDETVAAAQAPHAGTRFELFIEAVEPMTRFSFRWHPYAVEPGVSYANEPTTLVTFELAEAEGGTALTVVESGFDQIPLSRRAKAFAANEEGWQAQMNLITKYLHRDTH